MSPLRLTICLRVVAAAENNPGTKQLPHLCPEATSETRIPVMKDLLWNTKQNNNVLEEKLGALLSSERPLPHVHRDQPHKLGQAVNHSKNPIQPITTHRELRDEVHAPAVESRGGNWEGLQ